MRSKTAIAVVALGLGLGLFGGVAAAAGPPAPPGNQHVPEGVDVPDSFGFGLCVAVGASQGRALVEVAC